MEHMEAATVGKTAEAGMKRPDLGMGLCFLRGYSPIRLIRSRTTFWASSFALGAAGSSCTIGVTHRLAAMVTR